MKFKLSVVKLLMASALVLAPLAVSAEEAKAPAAVPAQAAVSSAKKAEAVPAVAPAAPAEAAKPKNVDPVLNTGDTAWILVSSALVLLMIPGLALFYGGMVRQKNVLSTMMHSFVAMGIVGVQWAVIGYSLSFGPDAGGGMIGNFSKAMLSGLISFK